MAACGIILGTVNCCPSSSHLCGYSVWVGLLLPWWPRFERWCPTARVARRKKCNLPVLLLAAKVSDAISVAFYWSVYSNPAPGKLHLLIWEAVCTSREGEAWRGNLWRLVTTEICCQPHCDSFLGYWPFLSGCS